MILPRMSTPGLLLGTLVWSIIRAGGTGRSRDLLFLLVPGSHAEVSVNLPLDDPAYPLLDKLVTSNLTFTNSLTIKPITRLYAARLIAGLLSNAGMN